MKKLLFSLCIICLIMSCFAAYADNAPVKEWTFENLSSFECNVDYVLGAAYPEKNVSLSNAYNHTLDGGTSVELKNRTKPEYRFKLTNAFNDSDRGKTFEIEAWIYAPNMSGEVSIGTYGDAGSKYAYAPMAKNSINVPKGEWTRITLEYTHEETTISQVGIDQKTGKAPIDILFTPYITTLKSASNYNLSDIRFIIKFLEHPRMSGVILYNIIEFVLQVNLDNNVYSGSVGVILKIIIEDNLLGKYCSVKEIKVGNTNTGQYFFIFFSIIYPSLNKSQFFL